MSGKLASAILLYTVANALALFDLLAAPGFHKIRWIYDVNTLYVPLLLLAAVAWLSIGIPARRAAARRGAALAALLIALRVWTTQVEPQWLAIREVSIPTPHVRSDLRILHLSDIQSDHVGAYEARVVETARRLDPDLVLFTGDLIQAPDRRRHQQELSRLAPLLAEIRPPLGMWGVIGDTDRMLEGREQGDLGGLRLLESEEATIDGEAGRVRLLGLSVVESRAHAARRVASFLRASRPGDVTIVLGHAPDYILHLGELPVDLCLAGHTHGGQIVVPFLGPPVIMSSVPRSWARGYRTFGRTRLNVSAGVGAEHAGGLPSLRFNCPSEMSLITLSPPL